MTKEINWDKVDQLFLQGASITQTAAALGIHRDTLYKKCEREQNTTLSTYYQEKYEAGNAIIHQSQFHKAIKDKNPTMLIWLGKQRLGQKENIEDMINKEIEKKFDEQMDQILSLLGSDRKIDESSISNETKS